MIQSRIDRFTDKTSPSGCWLWTRAKNAKGYGIFYGGLVHRAAYSRFVGPIPDGQYVLHKCDNRACCNPAHLYTGTQKDNMRDMYERGRQPRNYQPPGEKHSMAKLTEADALDVIRRVKLGERKSEIAALYGVGGTQVHRIATGQRWAHLQR
jgi:hypothetical protein